MAGLNVSDLSYAFGKLEILQEINFNLTPGQVISVVGPSGSGKTTLLRLCAGLMEWDEGRIENSFNSTAFVFQEPRLLPWQNVLDNISLGLRAKKVDKQEGLQKARQIACEFGLEPEDFSKYPSELSGGMRQRTAFARALILQPDLLFLDEPFSALDIGLKRELQDLLMEMVVKNQTSVLFITHDLMESVRMSDAMLVLQGSPATIAHRFNFDQPKHLRDDNYVFNHTAELLQHPVIRESFELKTTAIAKTEDKHLSSRNDESHSAESQVQSSPRLSTIQPNIQPTIQPNIQTSIQE